MKRWWSPHTVRAWPGQGEARHNAPETELPSSTWPSCGSTTTGRTPKNGSVAEPGLVGVTPGSGVISTPPVSVCHQVSITAQRASPTTSWYQRQISGLIGSPTEPRMRSESRR